MDKEINDRLGKTRSLSAFSSSSRSLPALSGVEGKVELTMIRKVLLACAIIEPLMGENRLKLFRLEYVKALHRREQISRSD